MFSVVGGRFWSGKLSFGDRWCYKLKVNEYLSDVSDEGVYCVVVLECVLFVIDLACWFASKVNK